MRCAPVAVVAVALHSSSLATAASECRDGKIYCSGSIGSPEYGKTWDCTSWGPAQEKHQLCGTTGICCSWAMYASPNCCDFDNCCQWANEQAAKEIVEETLPKGSADDESDLAQQALDSNPAVSAIGSECRDGKIFCSGSIGTHVYGKTWECSSWEPAQQKHQPCGTTGYCCSWAMYASPTCCDFDMCCAWANAQHKHLSAGQEL